MARKRAYKKRADYRKGGRVTYQLGGINATANVPTKEFTQADVDQAVADLNAGTRTATDLAEEYGVSPDYVNQNLATINTASGYTPPDIDLGEFVENPGAYNFPDTRPAPAPAPDPDPAPAPTTTIPAAISSIPADGAYTPAETNAVFNAINNKTLTVEDAAAQFGVNPSQVQAEFDRINQVSDAGATSIPDPFVGGLPNIARGQAVSKTIEDVSFKDAAGKTAYVPGSYLKNYKPVNIDTAISKQQATAIDTTGTITPNSAIQNLKSFSGITGIDDATSTAITAASGTVEKGIADGTIKASDYEAALTGELSKTIPAFAGAPSSAVMAELRALTSPAQAAQISATEARASQASVADYTIDSKAFVPDVTGATATLSDNPQAEASSRAAITGKTATGEEAKIIEQVGYTARQRAAITGEAAKGAAANVIAVTGNIPSDVAAAVVEDPASVTAMVDTQPIEVQAAIAALPPEALVSAQMETLLGGMESGTIPMWAKPAVAAVEQGLASRGLGVSTVGRDALFNSIIQTALPIAQSNAQALQNNAAQNLTNQQTANLEEARLNSTRRLSNLSNQQTAASQTAQFAQNLKVLQSQQGQEAALLSAQQQQQVRVQNLQNRQRSAELTAQNQQQTNSQELGNAQQIELAELEIKNQAEQQNMTAQNQERLAEMQVAADFLSKNAGFKQQMELANLSSDQQMRLANLTAQNQAASETLSNAQQTELTNLNAKMQTNITSANIAAQMNVAQLSVDQQRAVTNATTQAKIDLTKFSAAQQVELANSQFMQNTTLTNMNARQQSAMQNATAMASLDLSTADSRTKLAVENARNFLQIDVANLNNAQQAVILDTQMSQQQLLSNQAAENAAKQFSSTSENQINTFLTTQENAMEQFNASQSNAMSQFNASESNRLAALDANNAVDVAKFNAQVELQVEQFNSNIDNQRDIWNASNAQAIEQANTNWRRQSNTANTAAINAANAQNVQNAYGISTQELDFLWNTLRDEATFLRKQELDTAAQKTNMYITAMNNESNTAINNTGVANGVKDLIEEIFG